MVLSLTESGQICTIDYIQEFNESIKLQYYVYLSVFFFISLYDHNRHP